MEPNINLINIEQLLIELIINNTRLNYDKNDLRIDDDTAIIQVVKILAKVKYQARFKELKESNKED